MSEIKAIKIAGNQYIYVETDADFDDAQLPKAGLSSLKPDTGDNPDGYDVPYPEDASPCGLVGDAVGEAADALKAVQQTIQSLAETVYNGFQSHQPNEWTLELNIGFKGKTAIPVIVSGEASAAIKLTAKWCKQ